MCVYGTCRGRSARIMSYRYRIYATKYQYFFTSVDYSYVHYYLYKTRGQCNHFYRHHHHCGLERSVVLANTFNSSLSKYHVKYYDISRYIGFRHGHIFKAYLLSQIIFVPSTLQEKLIRLKSNNYTSTYSNLLYGYGVIK